MIIITSYHCETKLHIGMTVLFLSRFHFYVISHCTKTGICVIKLTESCDGPSSGIFVADDVEGASPTDKNIQTAAVDQWMPSRRLTQYAIIRALFCLTTST